MQNQFVESVHRSSLPARVRKKLAQTKYVRVTYEVDKESEMPPEEDFRPEFVEEVRESEESYKRGEVFHCRTKEERRIFFQSIRDENE